MAAAQSNCSHRDFVTWRWDGSLWKMLSVKQKAVKINLTKVFMILNTCLMKVLSQNPPFFWTINGFFQHLVSSSALKSFHYSTRSQSHLFSSWSPIITRFHVLFLHPPALLLSHPQTQVLPHLPPCPSLHRSFPHSFSTEALHHSDFPTPKPHDPLPHFSHISNN